MQITLKVERPKMIPHPPVARMTASPGKARIRHRFQVLRDRADADAVVIEDGLEEVPELELADHLLARNGDAVFVDDVARLPAAHLLIERVEELLPVVAPANAVR